MMYRPRKPCFEQPRRLLRRLLLTAVLGVLIAQHLNAQSVVNFQGRLFSAGAPASGDFDLRFSLYASPAGGSQLGSSAEVLDATLVDGDFNLALDFGAQQFDPDPLWVAIEIRPAGQGNYTLLQPRQRLKITPRAVLAARFGTNAVDSGSIADGTLQSADIAFGAATSSTLADNAVGNSELDVGFLASGEIANDAVTSDQLASNAVLESHIANNAVGASEIAENAVGQSEIANDAVSSNKIASGAVTGSKIANGAVGASEIGGNQVGSSKIANSAVGAADIDSNAVQRRISGTCAAGSSIRSIDSDGSVACENDDQGITSLYGNIEVFLASSGSGGGIVDVNMGSLSDKLCFISSVELTDVDGSSEIAECILINLGTWILRANSAGSDAVAECEAMCLSYVTDP